ncbi:MAG: phage/plasmid primase, P4 family [Spirochaetia bacterium]|jgi:putative DNA primase/helicase
MAPANNPSFDRNETDALKSRLRDYLSRKGRLPDGSGKYQCVCPENHSNGDSHFSCTLYDEERFYCPICESTIDVYEIAGVLEHLRTFPEKKEEVKRTLGIQHIEPQSAVKQRPKREGNSRRIDFVPLPLQRAREVYPAEKLLEMARNSKFIQQQLGGDPQKIRIGEVFGHPAVWPYKNPNGEVEIVNVRFEDGTPGKKAFMGFWFDGRYVRAKKCPTRLLGIPGLLEHPDLPVLVIEGEKCWEAAGKIPGFVPVTWNGGAKRAKYVDWVALAGRDVFVFPDDDAPGIQAIFLLADLLRRIARNVRIVMPLEAARTIKARGADIVEALQIKSPEEIGEYLRTGPELLPANTAAGQEAASLSSAPDEDETRDPASLVKDYGHASVLAPFFLGKYRWAFHRKTWMRDNGILWEPIPDELFSKKASDMLRKEYTGRLRSATTQEAVNHLTGLLREICTYTRIQGALSFLKGWPGIHTNPGEWDRDLWALNVRNGVVDLHTGKLREHRSEDLMTKVAPVDFDANAKGPRWSEHLGYFLPDMDIRRQVQRTLGLSLVGVTMEEALDIWYGKGGNGKTTTSRVIMTTLGDYAKRAAPNLLVASKYDRHPTEIADLAGVRLVVSIEIEKAKKLAEALVKELTGGDTKKARFMRCDFFEFSQTFSIILLVNHEPVITGTDDGIWRRIRLIPWNETIPVATKRPQEDVVEDLKAEGAAILNWLLEGLRDWQANRSWTSTKVTAATQKYREAQDFLGPFLVAKCEEGPHCKVSVADLYAEYETWCVEADQDPVSKKEIGEKLRNHGKYTKREGDDNVFTWQGIRLKARLHTTSNSISTPARSILAEEPEQESYRVVNPQKTPDLDFNSQASDTPPALPADISGLSTEDLRARHIELASYIDGDPPHAERMPDLERLAIVIAAREGGAS